MFKTKDIMTSNVITINAKETMTSANTIMREKKIRHLPVTDDKERIVGILSDRDVQLAMKVKRTSVVHQTISIESESLVEDFMSWPVYMVFEETSLKTVAEEMLMQKVSAFLVQDTSGVLRGIITTDDMLNLFLIGPIIRPEATIKSLTRHFFTPGK